MKEIILTLGKVALVDDEDYDWVNQYKWHAYKSWYNETFYAGRQCYSNEKERSQRMHRLIMNVTNSKIQVDHKDHNGLNNQRSNLRICTHAENQRNQRNTGKGSSKYKGVCWDKSRNKWLTCIKVDNKLKHIGRFINEIEAASAYNEAAKLYHGEFACLNVLGEDHGND